MQVSIDDIIAKFQERIGALETEKIIAEAKAECAVKEYQALIEKNKELEEENNNLSDQLAELTGNEGE